MYMCSLHENFANGHVLCLIWQIGKSACISETTVQSATSRPPPPPPPNFRTSGQKKNTCRNFFQWPRSMAKYGTESLEN